MNILFVSAVLPYPLYSGGQVRIYNLLKLLSEKHSITLLSFIRSEKERAYKSELKFLSRVDMVYRGKALQPKYLVKMFGDYPLLLETYNNEEMRQKIADELKTHPYDLVHIEPFYVYPSLPRFSVPLVVAEHNIEYTIYESYARTSLLPMRLIQLADAEKIRIWEERVWKKAATIVAVSQSDARQISAVTNKSISVVPNGVDVSSFSFVQHTFNVKTPTFVFIGNFAWAPNREAIGRLLKDIWPSVIKTFHGAMLTIVGDRFPESLKRLTGQNVKVLENVPDIRQTFAQSDVLLAPMGISGGSKFKILEAMASGTAVITTKAGRIGIDCINGVHFMEAETPKEYIDAISILYKEPQIRKNMLLNARQLVKKQYDWNVIAQTLDAVWKSQL